MTAVGSVIAGQQTVLVPRDATVLEAVRRMTERRIGAVPVVDSGRVVGIFSERDVMSRVVAAGRDPSATPVGDVMTTDLVVASPADDYESCLGLMQRAGVPSPGGTGREGRGDFPAERLRARHPAEALAGPLTRRRQARLAAKSRNQASTAAGPVRRNSASDRRSPTTIVNPSRPIARKASSSVTSSPR